MELGSIERELHVDATPEVVFDVLTRPEHIRAWWDADTAMEPRTGATDHLTWVDKENGGLHTEPFTITELDPPRLFSFRWVYEEGAMATPANSLLVTFELEPTESGTTVRFRETGYREKGWEAAVLQATYEDHERGWDYFLPRLADTAALAGVR